MTVNARAGPSLRRPPEAAACAGMADADRCAWRLIIDAEPRSGPANMALDEAIACAVARSDAPPTLRLYAWRPWAVSIGRFQSARDVDAAAVRERGGELVRRLSGGRALLHAEEVTYAVLLPQGDPHARDGVLATYRRLSAGLVQGLQRLGVKPDPLQPSARPHGALSAACFEAPSAYEITVRDRKLMGSAQCKRGGYVLQHGSLPLRGDQTALVSLLRMDADAQDGLRTTLRNRAVSLEQLRADDSAAAWSWERVATALAEGFRHALRLCWTTGSYRPSEWEAAGRLIRAQYANDAWTYGR